MSHARTREERGGKRERKEENDEIMFIGVILVLSPLILGVWTIIGAIKENGKRHPGLAAFTVIGVLLIILFWILCLAGVID